MTSSWPPSVGRGERSRNRRKSNRLPWPRVDVVARDATHVSHVSDLERSSMTGKIKLIALREYLSRLRQRSFQISTAIQLIGVLVLAFVPVITTAFSGSSTAATKIAVLDTSG